MSELDERSALVALSTAQLQALEELIQAEQELRAEGQTIKGKTLDGKVLAGALIQLQIALYALREGSR